MVTTRDLTTPALLLDVAAFDHNLATMAVRFPGARLRPHVKAHKSTSIATAQVGVGHRSFTCATVREVEGMAAAGLGSDLLLANEVVSADRLGAVAATGARVTLAVDSEFTVRAAAAGGVQEVVIDVNVGLPRCGCTVEDSGRLADLARSLHLQVRGVMGYEGHLMMADAKEQTAKVEIAMETLLAAHERVGGELISAGGTGTHRVNTWANEIQAGSYALMDSQYAGLNQGFRQALWVESTVISVNANGPGGKRFAVLDAGLKAFGMDHGNPSIPGADVWFCSDEHITFHPHADGQLSAVAVGDRVRIIPAHCDPTVAYHESYVLIQSADQGVCEVVDRWPVDLRGW
jgi:D-threonine aldolase